MQAAALAASVPGLCRPASCDAGHAATAREDTRGGNTEGLSDRHLPEAQPSLTGKELSLSFSCELLPLPSALQEMIHFVSGGARFRYVTRMFKGVHQLATSHPRRNTYRFA